MELQDLANVLMLPEAALTPLDPDKRYLLVVKVQSKSHQKELERLTAAFRSKGWLNILILGTNISVHDNSRMLEILNDGNQVSKDIVWKFLERTADESNQGGPVQAEEG